MRPSTGGVEDHWASCCSGRTDSCQGDDEVVPSVMALLGMFDDNKEEEKLDAKQTLEIIPSRPR